MIKFLMSLLLSKMPFELRDIAKFFLQSQDRVLRDFDEVVCMINKTRFAKKTQSLFYQNLEIFREDRELEEDIEILFDGFDNFATGLPIYCFGCLYDNQILVYDPQNKIFYWGNNENFFVNGTRIRFNCKLLQTYVNDRYIESNFIPDYLLISWYLGGLIQKPEFNEKFDCLFVD